MRSRLLVVLSRFVVLAVACLLASATITLAAGNETPAVAPAPAAAPAGPQTLVVPDVREQAYVFAKGTLEDAGFAWKVEGPVDGYAANVVVEQIPSPGTSVVDTGAPLVTLRLARNGSYGQEGEPENASPYPGTPLELAGDPGPSEAPAPASPAAPKPAAKPTAKSAAKAPTHRPAKGQPRKPTRKTSARPPAFVVPGAPAEPLDELPLDVRAKRLAAYVAGHPRPTDATVSHWLYQHTWIVTGARFGWYRGAEALATLVEVDRAVQRRWGIGGKSLAVARRALAEVRARS